MITEVIATPATLIEPIGDLTLDLTCRLCAAVSDAKRYGDTIVISLRSVAHVSWAALCELAEHVSSERREGTDVQFSDTLPRMRSLMRELGIGRGSFAHPTRFSAQRRIVLPA